MAHKKKKINKGYVIFLWFTLNKKDTSTFHYRISTITKIIYKVISLLRFSFLKKIILVTLRKMQILGQTNTSIEYLKYPF